MTPLSAVRAANAAFSPSYIPVALFFGGTSGIGATTAQAFARYTKGKAHIIICGRNRAAAESIIASFPESPQGRYEFVECDATLMKNVQATTSDLLSKLPKLNFLVESAGYLTLKGRDETTEGLDKKLALNYYARWKFIRDLTPLLRKAKDAGEDAKVMTILAAGKGGVIDLDDLGLKKGYSLYNSALAAATYNDLMIESFAAQQPDMAFTHIFPGFVRTPILKLKHWALRPLNPLIYALLYPFSVSVDECAEYMLHALLEGEKGPYRRDANGELLGKESGYFSTEEARQKLWDHTVEATTVS
jgi:NAD(P)-dependent dehydrogenase (short-subunit alcohol dehydrogenase family)